MHGETMKLHKDVRSWILRHYFVCDVENMSSRYHPMSRIVLAAMQRWTPSGSSETQTLSLSKTVMCATSESRARDVRAMSVTRTTPPPCSQCGTP
jgi:hypothetical protein